MIPFLNDKLSACNCRNESKFCFRPHAKVYITAFLRHRKYGMNRKSINATNAAFA